MSQSAHRPERLPCFLMFPGLGSSGTTGAWPEQTMPCRRRGRGRLEPYKEDADSVLRLLSVERGEVCRRLHRLMSFPWITLPQQQGSSTRFSLRDISRKQATPPPTRVFTDERVWQLPGVSRHDLRNGSAEKHRPCHHRALLRLRSCGLAASPKCRHRRSNKSPATVTPTCLRQVYENETHPTTA